MERCSHGWVTSTSAASVELRQKRTVSLVMPSGPARRSSARGTGGIRQSDDTETIEDFLVSRYGETSPRDAEDATWITPSGRLVGNGADHEESAARALRAIGLRFSASRSIGSCDPAVDEMIRRGFIRWTFVDDLMGVDASVPTARQIQTLRGLVKRYPYVTSFRYDLRKPVGKSGESFDDFLRDAGAK